MSSPLSLFAFLANLRKLEANDFEAHNYLASITRRLAKSIEKGAEELNENINTRVFSGKYWKRVYIIIPM